VSYFVSIPTVSKINHLPVNPCTLLNFQLLVLSENECYESENRESETLAVLLGGRATFTIGGELFERVGGRADVFSGKPHAVYIPCLTGYTITGVGRRTEIALVSAPSELITAPYVIPPERVTSFTAGAANFSREIRQVLTLAAQPDLPARRLVVGEMFTPSGNWGVYPPHKHESDQLPEEAAFEELYFFRLNPPEGFGLLRSYTPEMDSASVISQNTLLLAPNGYHTLVSAPGYTTYTLWAMAGSQRVQASAFDPVHAWVNRTVPMLKAVGG
jgi:5-deoxy-glucuronate isomerase